MGMDDHLVELVAKRTSEHDDAWEAKFVPHSGGGLAELVVRMAMADFGAVVTEAGSSMLYEMNKSGFYSSA